MKSDESAARALAERMRSFDAALSESEVAQIAERIEKTLAVGKQLDPEGKRLRNSDEPVPEFAAEVHPSR